MIEFREPIASDIDVLVAKLRAADLAELHAAGQSDAREVIEDSLRLSTQSWAALVDGELALLMGVAPLGGLLFADAGVPWLLGTDLVLSHHRALMRRCPVYIARMLRAYPRLVNFVHAENTAAVRWLRHTGFRLDAPAPHGPKLALFRRFEMTHV